MLSLPSLIYSSILPYSDTRVQHATGVRQHWRTLGKGCSKSGRSLPSCSLVSCRSLGSKLRSLWFGTSSILFNQEPSVWHTASVINIPLLIFILTVICTSKLLSSQRWSHILWTLDERLLLWAWGPAATQPLWRGLTCSTNKCQDSPRVVGLLKMSSLSVACHSWPPFILQVSLQSQARNEPLWLD